jgi:hypothetical protein
MPRIDVIGKGNVGDKARQLMLKSDRCEQFGFNVPRRTVLAEDYFDGFFQRNNLGSSLQNVQYREGLDAAIRKGTLTQEEYRTLDKVCRSYGDDILAVRSSAQGDSRGTGIYRSEFALNRFDDVKHSLLRVLGSYFSPNAVAFRKDAATGDGFGVIVEPLIGEQSREWKTGFAPIISGFGYTSTARGAGYLNVVPGLGGGVEAENGEMVTREMLEKFDGNLGRYVLEAQGRILDGWQERRASALLGINFEVNTDDWRYRPQGLVFNRAAEPSDSVENVSLSSDCDIDRLADVNLFPVFDMMGRMENEFGKPQYFEWAMTLSERNPKYWLLQIADVDKNLDVMDFGDVGKILFSGHSVIGTGVKDCTGISYCWNPDDVWSVSKFNEANKNYVLIYSSHLASSMAGRYRLEYIHINNASVLLCLHSASHGSGLTGHFEGQLDMTGKFFAVVEGSSLGLLEAAFERSNFYDRPVRVISSEKQNRLLVTEKN